MYNKLKVLQKRKYAGISVFQIPTFKNFVLNFFDHESMFWIVCFGV